MDIQNFIDLDLPSGRLWSAENEQGYYTFDEAVERFGDQLPSAYAWIELCESCQWTWSYTRKGYDVTGKNGNSIFLPAAGSRYGTTLYTVGTDGYYWSSVSYSVTRAYYLYFNAGSVGPSGNNYRYRGFSVRLVREA